MKRWHALVVLMVMAGLVAACGQALAKPGQMSVRVVSKDGLDTPRSGVLVQATVPKPDPPGGDEVVCEGSTDAKGKTVLKPLDPKTTYKVKVTYEGKTYTQTVTTDKKGCCGQITFRVP
jgi:hypothetical protein